ncbi:MAG: YbhB/YbcL family Raf kinase inhibitor-like protein [Candidatus Pacebacteria bacterium]|nr:YbhB/YbcL family Raf kinase inhibitor-like protein [Candidatus Paceibacterota bacterium]
MELRSGNFSDMGRIPEKCGLAGGNKSPRLIWSAVPEGTKSFAIIMADLDIPWGTEFPGIGMLPPKGTLPDNLFIHWIIVDIPAVVRAIPEGASPNNFVPRVKELKNNFNMLPMPGLPTNSYGGPGTPANVPAHRYEFTLYALDTETLGLAENADYTAFKAAISGHIKAKASITGYFGGEILK